MDKDNKPPRSFVIVRLPDTGFSIVKCDLDCSIGSQVGRPKIQPEVIEGIVVPFCSAARSANNGSLPVCVKEVVEIVKAN